MRLVQFSDGDGTSVGVMRGDDVLRTAYGDMLSFIRDGDAALDAARRLLEDPDAAPAPCERLLAPITNPGKIWGSGPNYQSHGDEDPEWEPAEEPMWDFIKLSSAITGPYDDIVIPPHDDVIKRLPGGPARFSDFGFAVDWEVELGVVISKTAKNVRRGDAGAHIFGYTVINDVGARSVQFHFGQRDLGKNFDTFCPMGPCIVTADEIEDPPAMILESYVNGERKQHELVGDQLNPPDVAIEWLSSVSRLDPGDVLSTGTPAGVGTFANPVTFLSPGDVVRCSISGIGQIENHVVQGTERTYPGKG
jgi:2-keto-4-pentenoate hydratase/2-oxohepta-3-ene-1,7-dioic acid hydratase in catechol pathway